MTKVVIGCESDSPEWRIQAFFGYWRTRLTFIQALELPEHWHEANVLVWAALDALSNLWAKQIGRPYVEGSGLKSSFDSFLARYGGEPFGRVSLPDIWHRAALLPCPEIPPGVRSLLQVVDRNLQPTVLDRHLREVTDDPDRDALLARLLTECPEGEPGAVKQWVSLSRYGAIAYKRMRSAYLHEGRSGKGTHSFPLHDSETSPTYLSMKYEAPAVLGFTPAFMTTVLGRCIDAFEHEALSLRTDPVPPAAD